MERLASKRQIEAFMHEFLHVEDLAESVRFVMEYEGKLEHDLINVGKGKRPYH